MACGSIEGRNNDEMGGKLLQVVSNTISFFAYLRVFKIKHILSYFSSLASEYLLVLAIHQLLYSSF